MATSFRRVPCCGWPFLTDVGRGCPRCVVALAVVARGMFEKGKAPCLAYGQTGACSNLSEWCQEWRPAPSTPTGRVVRHGRLGASSGSEEGGGGAYVGTW
jgi:hypothetical protein